MTRADKYADVSFSITDTPCLVTFRSCHAARHDSMETQCLVYSILRQRTGHSSRVVQTFSSLLRLHSVFSEIRFGL